jgi:hypothetical protein
LALNRSGFCNVGVDIHVALFPTDGSIPLDGNGCIYAILLPVPRLQ